MWRKMIIRRTSQSRIPFRTNSRIANSLSRVKVAIINYSFNASERSIYEDWEVQYIEKLIIIEQN